MKEKLFRAYVRYIRPFTEQWLNSIYHKDTPFDYWGLVKDLPMQKFSDKINAYVYKMDKLGGLLDHAMFFETPNQFFVERDSNRDCDNFARIWAIWAIYHGYEYQEVIVTTKQRIIRDSHVVTAIHINNYWYLCDYTPYGLYSTKDEAIEDIVNHWEKYTEDNLLYEYYYGRH